MNKSKKAQIEMTENVLILFIFFILLVFAIVFYSQVQSTKIQQVKSQDVTDRAMEIAQKVTYLPEIRCTKDAAETILGCYDEYNIKSLQNLTKSKVRNQYYQNLFRFSSIYVKKIFPNEEEILIYNYTLDNYTSVTAAHLPMAVCDFLTEPGIQKCNFGDLSVYVYE